MTKEPLQPFFQGSVAQVRELAALCADRELSTIPIEPPGGTGGG